MTSCYLLALQAVYEYWVTDGNNETVGGVPMIQTTFMSVWNWDARPFPTFPQHGERLGRHGRLAGRQLARRQGTVPHPARPEHPAGAGAVFDLPVDRHDRMVGQVLADLLDRHRDARVRQGAARREIRRPALEHRTELRRPAAGLAL